MTSVELVDQGGFYDVHDARCRDLRKPGNLLRAAGGLTGVRSRDDVALEWFADFVTDEPKIPEYLDSLRFLPCVSFEEI